MLRGVERSGEVLLLPRPVTESLLARERVFLDGELGSLLVELGFAEAYRRSSPSSREEDRNRVFAAALCDGVDDPLAALRSRRFIVVGCGGLGANVAVTLAALGTTQLTLIDGDIIEPSNLSRLLWASPEHVGASKVAVLGEHLGRRFGVQADVVTQMASSDLAGRILDRDEQERETPIWVLTVDQPDSAREVVARLHRQARFSYVHAGYVGARCSAGPVAVDGGDPCPFCDASHYRVDNHGYVAPSAAPNNQLIASLLAAQLLRLATLGPSGTFLRGHRWALDLVSGGVETKPLRKSRYCEVCS